MPRCLRLLAVELILLAAPLATLAAGPPKPLVFEISYSKELSASPMDGHVLLIISKGDLPVAAGFGVQEGLETQQAFGVDVDGWQPGTAVRVDSSTLGYPLESLRELVPGEYSVRAVLNIYETFHLGNGKVVKLPPDKGEGQHWQTKPGNFLSAPQKLHLDPEASGTIRITLDHKIPAARRRTRRSGLGARLAPDCASGERGGQQVGKARPHAQRAALEILGTSD